MSAQETPVSSSPEIPPEDGVTQTNTAEDKVEASPQEQPENTEFNNLRKELDLEPRRIILAKVKGYRAWPAMVLDEAYLPENIRNLKPKSIKLAKKLKKPVIMIPVRFFSDDTYIWMKSCDVMPLNGDAIEAYLAKKAHAKKDTLTDAYKLALSPPDMLEFIAWGSKGQPPSPDLTALDNEPKQKKLKLSFKLKPQKKTTKRPTPPISYNGSLEFSDEDDPEGFDSDWGLEELEVDYENGDYIFDNEEEQRNFENFPRASELAETLSIYQDQFAGLHYLVSPQLMLDGPGDEKKVLTELRKVEKLVSLTDTPLIAFRKSPLYRVLLLTVHKPQEVSKSENVRSFIEKIFGTIALQPCSITLEDLVTRDPSIEPSEPPEVSTAIALEGKGEGDGEVEVKGDISEMTNGADVLEFLQAKGEKKEQNDGNTATENGEAQEPIY